MLPRIFQSKFQRFTFVVQNWSSEFRVGLRLSNLLIFSSFDEFTPAGKNPLKLRFVEMGFLWKMGF